MKDVTAAIIIENNKVLLTRRAPGEKHAGWWEFPGGKVEPGESPELALQRELFEELEIDAAIGEKLIENIHRYDTGTIRLMAYRATILSGALSLHVHDEYQWVDVSDLNQYQLLPADLPIAAFLGKLDAHIHTSGGAIC